MWLPTEFSCTHISFNHHYAQAHFDISSNDFEGLLPTELGLLTAVEYGFNVESKEGTRGAVLLRLDEKSIPKEVAALSSAVSARVLGSGYDDGHVWRASPPPSAQRYFHQEKEGLPNDTADGNSDESNSNALVTAISGNAGLRVAVKKWCSDPTAAEEEYGHISTWDTTSVTDMSHLFGSTGHCASYASFNEDLSAWMGELLFLHLCSIVASRRFSITHIFHPFLFFCVSI